MQLLSVLLHLGYGFLRASVTYPVRIGRGRDRFLKGYGVEGMVPVTKTFRASTVGFERCLGCGFCELALPRHLALSDFARSSWRSPETWSAISSLLDELDAEDLERAEALCPADVPLQALVKELSSMLRRWSEMRGGTPRAETTDDIHSTIGEESEAEL
jgi:ferredoxin